MEPDPDADSRSAFRLPGIVHALHTTCRPQGAGTGAKDVVGAFNRGVPEGHNAVTNELIDGTTLFRYRAGNFLEIGGDLDQQIIRRESLGVAGEIL